MHPLGLTPFTPQIHEADLKPLSFASHAYPTFHLLMPLYSECGSALPAKFWGKVALHISSDSTPPAQPPQYSLLHDQQLEATHTPSALIGKACLPCKQAAQAGEGSLQVQRGRQ